MGIIQSAVNQMLGSVGIASGVVAGSINRRTEAMKKVAQMQEEQKKQKRNFKDYLRRQPINGGRKLGDLGERAVESVAKQYTPYQRQKFMNTIDKEKVKK